GGRRGSAHGAGSAGIAAAVAAAALAAFLERDRGNDEGGERVGPPPAGERVRAQPQEERDREVGAELRLCRFLDGGGGVELVAEPPFRVGEQRHRRRGERGQADPDPARGRVIGVDERAQRLDADVGGEQEEADGDQLLRAPLGAAGAGRTDASRVCPSAVSEYMTILPSRRERTIPWVRSART